MRNEGGNELFPIHGHHNGSKLSYTLKLANNKKKHLPFGIVEFDNNKKEDLNNKKSCWHTIGMIGMLESSR
jgi:hypothetical protein